MEFLCLWLEHLIVYSIYDFFFIAINNEELFFSPMAFERRAHFVVKIDYKFSNFMFVSVPVVLVSASFSEIIN
jgi:succinylarginine dihydrolase